MGKTHKVVANGEVFTATRGDVLLDAALMAGIDLPHDCRAGQCGSCAVTVVEGHVYGGECSEPGMVLACQCRVISDLEVAVEHTPDVQTMNGVVGAIRPLCPDVVEVRIDTKEYFEYLPGQYARVKFRGFPERCYSPTVPLDRPWMGKSVFLQVRKMEDGRVSSELGREIIEGHKVKLTGPFGSAFLRDELDNRLVLIATGTGFAPIWAIANAAIAENPEREIVVIVGARTIDSLYMARALQRIATYPNVKVIPVASMPQNVTKVVRQGRPTDFIPTLSGDDIVYVCGAPLMVDSVKEIARSAGAACYADPFIPQNSDDDNIWAKALNWIKGEGKAEQPKQLPPPPPRPAPGERPVFIAVDSEAPMSATRRAAAAARASAQPRSRVPAG